MEMGLKVSSPTTSSTRLMTAPRSSTRAPDGAFPLLVKFLDAREKFRGEMETGRRGRRARGGVRVHGLVALFVFQGTPDVRGQRHDADAVDEGKWIVVGDFDDERVPGLGSRTDAHDPLAEVLEHLAFLQFAGRLDEPLPQTTVR